MTNEKATMSIGKWEHAIAALLAKKKNISCPAELLLPSKDSPLYDESAEETFQKLVSDAKVEIDAIPLYFQYTCEEIPDIMQILEDIMRLFPNLPTYREMCATTLRFLNIRINNMPTGEVWEYYHDTHQYISKCLQDKEEHTIKNSNISSWLDVYNHVRVEEFACYDRIREAATPAPGTQFYEEAVDYLSKLFDSIRHDGPVPTVMPVYFRVPYEEIRSILDDLNVFAQSASNNDYRDVVFKMRGCLLQFLKTGSVPEVAEVSYMDGELHVKQEKGAILNARLKQWVELCNNSTESGFVEFSDITPLIEAPEESAFRVITEDWIKQGLELQSSFGTTLSFYSTSTIPLYLSLEVKTIQRFFTHLEIAKWMLLSKECKDACDTIRAALEKKIAQSRDEIIEVCFLDSACITEVAKHDSTGIFNAKLNRWVELSQQVFYPKGLAIDDTISMMEAPEGSAFRAFTQSLIRRWKELQTIFDARLKFASAPVIPLYLRLQGKELRYFVADIKKAKARLSNVESKDACDIMQKAFEEKIKQRDPDYSGETVVELLFLDRHCTIGYVKQPSLKVKVSSKRSI